LEPKVEAVVAKAAYLRMVSVVTHADNRDLAQLDQLYQFLYSTKNYNVQLHGATDAAVLAPIVQHSKLINQLTLIHKCKDQGLTGHNIPSF